MKRKLVLMMLLGLCLLGCSQRDTMVYIPEEDAADSRDGIVVYIPVDPGAATAESQPTEAPAQTQPKETEAPKENTATISKNTGSSSNKGSSSNNGSTGNKGTITGSSSGKPAETQPPVTEPPAAESQTTITKPVATEPPATEPPVTEPVVTEPPATEPPVTEPVATEPPVTEPPATEPPATEPVVTEPPETQPPLYDISGYTVGALEYAMLEQINAHRADAGLPALTLDERLSAIASCRSYEVSLVWSHTRPDGRSYATVLDDYGYGAGSVTELLVYASGYADGTAMADRWMASDSHRESLLGGWSTAGIGVYDANGYTYVTCMLIG